MRPSSDQMEHAAGLADNLARVLFQEGYPTTKSRIVGMPGQTLQIIVQSPICGNFLVSEVILFFRRGKWRWYRNIAGGKIQCRDHFLALCRSSATVLVWARKHGLQWSQTSVCGREVRPLAEVQ